MSPLLKDTSDCVPYNGIGVPYVVDVGGVVFELMYSLAGCQ